MKVKLNRTLENKGCGTASYAYTTGIMTGFSFLFRIETVGIGVKKNCWMRIRFHYQHFQFRDANEFFVVLGSEKISALSKFNGVRRKKSPVLPQRIKPFSIFSDDNLIEGPIRMEDEVI